MKPGPALNRTELPEGFKCNAINCGVRKYRPDLGVLWSESDCVAAGVYTTNESKAAPVKYCQKILPSDKIRYVFTNSGQANAATGREGHVHNEQLAKRLADKVGISPEQVVMASTGVIGVPLEMEKLYRGIDEVIGRDSVHAEPFAVSIMTTDLIPKTVTKEVKLSQGTIRLTGISKGSGMIHPNMATMLAYVLTDAQLTVDQADSWLKEVADESFNMISVDGETSTNDSFFLLSNGAKKVAISNEEDEKTFKEALKEISIFLAKSIAADGEGASKLIEVNVMGSPDIELARKAARGITVSPLVKTAIHGEDPNWGRIYSRLGQDGIPGEILERLDLEIQGVSIVEKGQPVSFDYYKMKTRFSDDVVKIDIRLNSGDFHATAWGCDLTKKYVDINTEYN